MSFAWKQQRWSSDWGFFDIAGHLWEFRFNAKGKAQQQNEFDEKEVHYNQAFHTGKVAALAGVTLNLSEDFLLQKEDGFINENEQDDEIREYIQEVDIDGLEFGALEHDSIEDVADTGEADTDQADSDEPDTDTAESDEADTDIAEVDEADLDEADWDYFDIDDYDPDEEM